MATVPNTTTFSLQDVINVVGGTSLTAAFANAGDAQFDPTYKGSKNNLLNFRNYDTTRNATLTIDNTYMQFDNVPANTICPSYTRTINITTSLSWTASSSQSYFSVSPTSGTGNTALTVSAQKNTGGYRSGIISITSSAPTKTCAVDQDLNCLA